MKHSLTLVGLLLMVWMVPACSGGPEPESVSGGDSLQIAKKKGQAYFERGVPTMALPALQRARQLAPDDADVLLMLGMSYDQLNRPTQALEALQKAYALRPTDGKINNNLGVALMRLDRLDDVLGYFKVALADVNYTTPEDVYFNIALLHKRQGEQREMITALEQSLRVKPEFVPALMELAVFSQQMGRLDQEQDYLRQILAVEPGYGIAMELLAQSYIKTHHIREARMVLQKMRALAPESHGVQRIEEKLGILEREP